MAVAQPSQYSPVSDVNSNQNSAFVPPEQPPKKKLVIKLPQIANILLVVGVVMFVASVAYAIQNAQTSTNTRASTDIDVNTPSSPGNFLLREKNMTESFTEIPKTINGQQVPDTLLADAKAKYPDYDEAYLKNYLINRVIMSGVIRGELKKKNVSYPTEYDDLSLEGLEKSFPYLKKLAIDNLISTADYSYMQFRFDNQLNLAQLKEQYGDDLQSQALEMAQEFKGKLEASPSATLEVIQSARLNPKLMDFNQYEPPGFQVKNYYDDLNDVPDQSEYMFDEDFDKVLYTLEPNKVSDVITLNSNAPYIHVVVLPTRIDKKDYQSFKEMISNYKDKLVF